MIIALTFAACMMLNRFAGGGVWAGEWWNPARADKLWGRALYPAIVLIGLVALIWHPWPVALAFAGAFGFWRSFSWGALIDLGRSSGADHREHNPVEAMLLRWFGHHWGLFVRHCFVFPGLVAIELLTGAWASFLVFPFAAIATLTYELAWRFSPRAPIRNAELAVGALWGALIIVTGAAS